MVRTLVLHDRPAGEAAGLLARLLGPAMTAPLTAPPADWSDVLACVLVLAHAGLTAAGLDRLARTVPRAPPGRALAPPVRRRRGAAAGRRRGLRRPARPCRDRAGGPGRPRRRGGRPPAAALPRGLGDARPRASVRSSWTGSPPGRPAPSAPGTATRCGPRRIEYLVIDDRLYLLSEGGEKFAHLLANPRVSVAVYDPFVSMTSLFGLQLTGRAALVPAWSVEYRTGPCRKGARARAGAGPAGPDPPGPDRPRGGRARLVRGAAAGVRGPAAAPALAEVVHLGDEGLGGRARPPAPGVGLTFICFWNAVWDCQAPALTPRTPRYWQRPRIWTCPVSSTSGTGSIRSRSVLAAAIGVRRP